MLQHQIRMQRPNLAGSKLVVVDMGINHVTVTASKSIPSNLHLHPDDLETLVLDLARLLLGIDVVTLVHLAVATAPCMTNTVEMVVTMVAQATVIPTEAEEAMDIDSEVQMDDGGAQVHAVEAMRLVCPHRAPRQSDMTQV